MSKTIKMDAAGRVVIPQAVREKYGLLNGSHRLELVESPDGIVLRPRVEEIPAQRRPSGWLVFRSESAEAIDPVRAVERERERRHAQIRRPDPGAG